MSSVRVECREFVFVTRVPRFAVRLGVLTYTYKRNFRALTRAYFECSFCAVCAGVRAVRAACADGCVCRAWSDGGRIQYLRIPPHTFH